MSTGPTLGSIIRGARLGYGWLPSVGFVRVIDGPGERFTIDVRPADALPRSPDGEYHRVWWSDPVASRMLRDTIRRRLFGGLVGGYVRRPVTWSER